MSLTARSGEIPPWDAAGLAVGSAEDVVISSANLRTSARKRDYSEIIHEAWGSLRLAGGGGESPSKHLPSVRNGRKLLNCSTLDIVNNPEHNAAQFSLAFAPAIWTAHRFTGSVWPIRLHRCCGKKS
jgi:hypothetical protein